MERSVKGQLGPVVIDKNRSSSPGAVEVVHEPRILVGGGASQQITANVAIINGEIDEGIDDDRSGTSTFVNGEVVSSGVTSGRELRGCAVVDRTKIDARSLAEVTGLTAFETVTDESKVPHANRRDDSAVVTIDMRDTNRQNGTGEVSGPIVDGTHGVATSGSRGTLEIDQEEVVVQESTRNKSVTTSGLREELRLHQTDVDVDGEGTKVSAVGKGSGRSVEGAQVVALLVEVTDGTAEGKRIYDITDRLEVAFGVGVEERCRPDKVGDNETLISIPLSAVGIETGQSTFAALNPTSPSGEANGFSVLLEGTTSGHGKLVQPTRRVTCIVAHLTDDPRGSRSSMELIGTPSIKIVRGVESGFLIVCNAEDEHIITISTVDLADGYFDEEAQETTCDDPLSVA